MVLDTMEVWSCVPRVPWNVFCCLVCKNIADTADFRVDDDCTPPPPPALNSFENTLREVGLKGALHPFNPHPVVISKSLILWGEGPFRPSEKISSISYIFAY